MAEFTDNVEKRETDWLLFIEILIFLFSLTGSIFLSSYNIIGFYTSIVSNSLSIFFFFMKKQKFLLAQQTIFLIINTYAIIIRLEL